MKQLSFRDLTPELMKELSACATAKEIIAACDAKELEISEKDADRLLAQFEKAKSLSAEELEKASGAGQPFTGTQLMKLGISETDGIREGENLRYCEEDANCHDHCSVDYCYTDTYCRPDS